MKRFLSLIFFFAVFALINGPSVYSTNDVNDNIDIKTMDSYTLPDIESEMILQPVCILSGGLELKLPTADVYLYVEPTKQFWLCTNVKPYNMETIVLSKLTDQSPDANSLAQTAINEGLTRLDIGESYVNRHTRKTYV